MNQKQFKRENNMKSITIHDLHKQLDMMIRKRARKDGKSLNKTIKNILEESLGIKKMPGITNRDEFMDLFGVWNKHDLNHFEKSMDDFAKIDKEDWK
jgi:hypothetical protein